MINIDKLADTLCNFKGRSYKLPQENKFTQRTAFQMKLDELENLISNNCEELNEYLDKRMIITSDHNINKYIIPQKQLINTTTRIISNSIIFNNEDILDIPNKLFCIFDNNIYKLDKTKYYLYGIKNDDSFYNATVLLTQKDYIIKSKSEKIGAIVSFKREMGLKVNTSYNNFDYKQLKFKKSNMIYELMEDGILNYSLIVSTSDYINRNICIIDVDKKSYLYIPTTIVNDNENDENDVNDDSHFGFLMMIRINDYYLPIMNTDGINIFNTRILSIIKDNFEKEEINSSYRERIGNVKMRQLTSNDGGGSADCGADSVETLPLQLKALSAYKLKDLQEIAIKYKVNIKKNDNGKEKNKTKAELYNELI
jgi:hypothetical protein